VYRDSIGLPTIGVGRNLQDRGISEPEAMILLANDITNVLADLDRALPWWRTLSENRQLVLADLCFNIGIRRLLGFRKALAAMQAQDWELAAAEMKDSKWYGQVKSRGEELCELMRTG